jgi:hypothetical protein
MPAIVDNNAASEILDARLLEEATAPDHVNEGEIDEYKETLDLLWEERCAVAHIKL